MATLSDPDADVNLLVSTAQGIGERVNQNKIVDLVRYARRSLFRASKREKLNRLIRDNEVRISELTALSDSECSNLPVEFVSNAHNAIEAKVLVSEILKRISPIERDVVLRFTYGMKHPQIAAELNISAALSRHYLSSARKRLTELLSSAK